MSRTICLSVSSLDKKRVSAMGESRCGTARLWPPRIVKGRYHSSLHERDPAAMTDEIPLSRTQLKKQMTALQALGSELVSLNAEQLAEMALPESLHEAVMAAKQITRFEARRRQLQYIGKLMRHIDPEPIRARLERWNASSREHTARVHRLERWRERLLADDAALPELVRHHPHADIQRLRTLVRNARRERELIQPPRNYRALFKLLRETLEMMNDE